MANLQSAQYAAAGSHVIEPTGPMMGPNAVADVMPLGGRQMLWRGRRAFSLGGPRALGRRSRRGAAVGVGTAGAISSRDRPPGPSHAGSLSSSGEGGFITKPQATKGASLSRSRHGTKPPGRRLQCPIYKHLSPAWGQRVGGVSGRPAQETKRSDPLPCLLPRRWKAPWSTGSVASFAGCRKSMDLGRFVLRA
jgi:hypothetical protein